MNLLLKLALLLAIVLAVTATLSHASPIKKLRQSVDAAQEDGPKLYKPIILLENGADAENEVEVETTTEVETEAPAKADEPVLLSAEEIEEAKAHATPIALLEANAESEQQGKRGGGAGGAGDSNPTYVLPYPPLMPHFFTPFLNPYSNVNPLSFPYNYYYGQGGQGGHPPPPPPGAPAGAPGFAGAGAYGGPGAPSAYGGSNPYYPYYAFLERRTQMPWQLRTVGVGDNTASTFPQFLETDAEIQTEAETEADAEAEAELEAEVETEAEDEN